MLNKLLTMTKTHKFPFLRDGAENMVDCVVGRDGAVEGDKVALQALGDVVAAAARVDHGRQVLHVDQVVVVARLVQAVVALHLDHRPEKLVGHLRLEK